MSPLLHKSNHYFTNSGCTTIDQVLVADISVTERQVSKMAIYQIILSATGNGAIDKDHHW